MDFHLTEWVVPAGKILESRCQEVMRMFFKKRGCQSGESGNAAVLS